jgi:hypothetical protein
MPRYLLLYLSDVSDASWSIHHSLRLMLVMH